MEDSRNEIKTQVLSKEEVEFLLAAEFGDKINPVIPEELAKRHRAEAVRRSVKVPWSTR